MDILVPLLSLALSIFVLIAIGQLFGIKRSLQRLVSIAEAQAARTHEQQTTAKESQPLPEWSDDELLAYFNRNTVFKDPAVVQEMKARGMFIP